MKTKIFTLLLAVAASVGTMFAWDYENVQIGDLYYNLDATNQTAGVTYQLEWNSNNYSGLTTAIIPASVNYSDVAYSVTSIGEGAFYKCSGLTSVTIPNSVTSIGSYAFYNCTGLTSVTIPGSVTSIGNYAFYSCSGLTSVAIPNSVTSIGNWAFAECTGLTSVNITDIAAWCNIAFSNYNSNPLYYAKHLYVNNVEVTNLVIPEGVTSIGSYAFYGCSGLTSVTIPGSVTSIGGGAFSGSSGLTSVTIPNSVTSIGNWAFENCSGLTSVTIGNSVTSIGDFAFYGCSCLTSVTIPNSVTSIGNWAFENCSGLTSVTIPESVTSIGAGAFEHCTGLTSPLYNAHVFAYLPTSYSGVYTIPDGIESIAGEAFAHCTGLTSVTIPNSVTSIGDGAFYYCTGLTSVTIGNSVTSIGNIAFSCCSGLTSVTNFANTPQEMGSSVFNNVKSTCVLYVPAGSISAYQSAKGWKDFKYILPIGAHPADVTTTTVTPSETTVDIAWPQVTGAATYTIEIKKNGELICTLTFNAQGQLISIALAAPSRNNAPQQAQAAGFSFTVTSLDSGTTYSYTMTAKDNNGNVLKTESGTFTTTGESQGIEDVPSNQVQGTKLLRNGQIFILRGEKVYTVTGQEVK